MTLSDIAKDKKTVEKSL